MVVNKETLYNEYQSLLQKAQTAQAEGNEKWNLALKYQGAAEVIKQLHDNFEEPKDEKAEPANDKAKKVPETKTK